MPYSNPKCPACGKGTSYSFDTALPPGGVGANRNLKMFQRYNFWFIDRELMCGYCRQESWLSRWSW